MNGPRLRVRYDAQPLTKGDATPSVAAGTDFGASDVYSVTAQSQFVIENVGIADLRLINTQGALQREAVSFTAPESGAYAILAASRTVAR